jgi:two-component system sensor histidine kinase KdpD
MTTRGRYKIFLGMAAGVGKTYRMLQEGRAQAEAGRDVAIGYVEPHDRPETTVQSEGLEIVPRRRMPVGDLTVEEMDLPGIIARRPELCLIDELAHTNAPGLEHEKRYEDIEDVLDAGVDVYSTVNVQHLETLNDQMAELTGVRVRETFPDSVLASADEIVLIDLTPQTLIERLRDGKIYPLDRIDVALNNFFRVENLNALREVALRQVAADVESRRVVREPLGTRDDPIIDAATLAVQERPLVLITPTPSAQRLVRRAWRSAQRLGAELDILWVDRRKTGRDQDEQLRALRKLASALGAHFLVEHGGGVAEVIERVARQRGSTYILIGEEQALATGPLGLRRSLLEEIMRRLPGVDVRIVTDRSKRPIDRS